MIARGCNDAGISKDSRENRDAQSSRRHRLLAACKREAAVSRPPSAIWRSPFLGWATDAVALQRNGTRKLDLGAFGRCSYSQTCAASGDFSLPARNHLRNFSVIV